MNIRRVRPETRRESTLPPRSRYATRTRTEATRSPTTAPTLAHRHVGRPVFLGRPADAKAGDHPAIAQYRASASRANRATPSGDLDRLAPRGFPRLLQLHRLRQALRPQRVVAEHVSDEGWPHERLRRVDQPRDAEERRGHVRIVGSSRVQVRHVPVADHDLDGPVALDGGEAQVTEGRDLPGSVDEPRDLLEEAQRVRLVMGLQVAAQRHRLQGGRRHPLAIDRVERAHRVAEHQQAGREGGQQLVPAAHAGRDPEGDGVVDGSASRMAA